jgi:hypothetical protein
VSHNANCDAGTNQERACDVQHQAALPWPDAIARP